MKVWLRWTNRIDALNLRERVLVFIALAALFISLISITLIDTQLAEQKKWSDQIVQTQQATATLHQQIQFLLNLNVSDPNAALKIKLANLRKQAEQSGHTLQTIQNRLVSPQHMPELLKTLLTQHNNVQLVALETLPVQALDAPSASNTSSSKPTTTRAGDTPPHVYKHGVEITLSGTYTDLVDDLSLLEHAPWRMFWGKADLSVDPAHHLQLTLRLYTLSQDQAWLSL